MRKKMFHLCYTTYVLAVCCCCKVLKYKTFLTFHLFKKKNKMFLCLFNKRMKMILDLSLALKL